MAEVSGSPRLLQVWCPMHWKVVLLSLLDLCSFCSLPCFGEQLKCDVFNCVVNLVLFRKNVILPLTLYFYFTISVHRGWATLITSETVKKKKTQNPKKGALIVFKMLQWNASGNTSVSQHSYFLGNIPNRWRQSDNSLLCLWTLPYSLWL